MGYINSTDINENFKKFLIDEGSFSEMEAEMGAYGFPYEESGSPFITEKYVDEVNIEGFRYEKKACTYSMYELNIVSGKHLNDFLFYKYYCLEDIEDGFDYSKARKLYAVDNIDINDFND